MTHVPPKSRPPSPGGQLWLRFDLAADQAAPDVIDAAIRAGVPFRGTNLWLLIFAIIMASVGLNVNSTAVIIGAMLISPLMGPIIGAGYGVAVADFSLVRQAAGNVLLATGVSLVASTLYFAATPLSEAHSELLARTTPTLWDVLIALFGGLAGIVGVTRKEKSNVVPGVAIATALMPPLCTAGYGLATGHFAWFAGAFYLFFINSVFIATATFIMARVMRLPEVEHVDTAASRRAHRWIVALGIGTALPSLLLAQRLVAEELFQSRAIAFLAAVFPPEGATVVVGREIDPARRRLRLTVIGEEVTARQREGFAALLPGFGLGNTTLAIAQNERQSIDVTALREGLVRDLYQHSLKDLEARAEAIEQLEGQVAQARSQVDLLRALEKEIAAQLPAARRVAVASSWTEPASLSVVIESFVPIGEERLAQLRAWLSVRAGTQDAWIVEAQPPSPDAGSPPSSDAGSPPSPDAPDAGAPMARPHARKR